MSNLDSFKSHIAFDSTYNLRGVNTIDQVLLEYNEAADTGLCKHSFYGGKSNFKILHSNPKQLSKQNKTRGRSRVAIQKSKLSKTSKNKTNKRMN
tara:strand:+ start:51 stop:335 length:285 start_codon:yes stop_codon:yes gene_type:complete